MNRSASHERGKGAHMFAHRRAIVVVVRRGRASVVVVCTAESKHCNSPNLLYMPRQLRQPLA